MQAFAECDWSLKRYADYVSPLGTEIERHSPLEDLRPVISGGAAA